MGFFDNFKEKATDLAQAGVAQSKRLAEIAKLNTANMAEEDTIKKAYIELGKLYYEEKGMNPDGPCVAACERITAARAAIETVFSFGRPRSVQLVTLVDRGHRELPIRPDYVGKNLPTAKTEVVTVLTNCIDGETAVYICDQ